jgi:hypothetical protein
MSDLYVESYKKSVTHILDYWNKKLADFAKQLEPIDDELDDLNNNNKPSDDDKKRIAELEKKRADIRKQVEAASLSLRVNLSVIELDDKANKTRGHETAGLAEGNHQGEGPSPGKECLDFGARLHRFQGNEADEIRASREMETFEPQPV